MQACRREVSGSFRERATRFLSDQNAEILTGERRSTPEDTVMHLRDIAEEQGFSVSVYPETKGDPQIMFFKDWDGNTPAMESYASSHPNTDVVYGQHLCHQVPAAVRYRPSR